MTKVTQLDNKRFEVTIDDVTRVIDIDLYNILSDEDYNRLDSLGKLQDDMNCPWLGDAFWIAVAKPIAAKNSFDVEKYLENPSDYTCWIDRDYTW